MKRVLLVAGVVGALSVQALELGAPFTDGAVLQREMSVPIWGTADASARVTVSFAGQKLETTAGADGAWRIVLAPMPASQESRDLVVTEAKDKSEEVKSADAPSLTQTIKQSNIQTITLSDVLVGEVWLCAGQSNMQVPLDGASTHFSDAKGALRASMTHKPLVRYFCSGENTALTPQRKLPGRMAWRTFQPENLTAGWRTFSAVGFYYALELHNALCIPVGVVGAYWGGTPIVAWTPNAGLASVEYTRASSEKKLEDKATFQKRIDAAKARGEKWLPQYHYQPSIIYNAMVAPLTPMAMRGFVWYQGETDGSRGTNYAHQLHALYNGWSKEFGNPSLMMRFAQLAPAGGNNSLALIMEGQATFAREEPNAKMAVISDRGALHDWHPRDKETVGMRLAALALKYDYGWKDVKADAPTLKDWTLKDGKFVLSFDHAERWSLYNEDWTNGNLFEIAGTNGVWHAATIDNMKVKEHKPYKSDGAIVGKDLIVFSSEVKEPAKLRYHYQKPQVAANLFNEAGLPLGPFHIDVK